MIGVAVDSASSKGIAIIKKTGKVALLEEEIKSSKFQQFCKYLQKPQWENFKIVTDLSKTLPSPCCKPEIRQTFAKNFKRSKKCKFEELGGVVFRS